MPISFPNYYTSVFIAILLFLLLGAFMFLSYTSNNLFNNVIINSYWYVLTFISLCLFTFFTSDLFDSYFYKIFMTLFNFVSLTVITYFAFNGQFNAFYYWIIVSILNLAFSFALVIFICPYLVWWINGSETKENNAANNALDFFMKLAKLFDVSTILYNRFFYLVGFLLFFGVLWLVKSLVSPSAFVYLLIAIISIAFIGYLMLIFYQNVSSKPINNQLLNFFADIPGITWVIIAFIIILLIIVFCGSILAGTTSTTKEIMYVTIIIGVVLAISGIAYKISTSDNNKSEGDENNESKTWKAIGGSWKIILYTIVLIICFCLIKKDILNKYAYIFTSLAVLTSVYFFYNGLVKNKDDNKNNNNNRNNSKSKTDIESERIKTIILFLCVIVISILLYSVDPGGVVNTYVGPNFIYTILLGLFGFLFMNVLLQYPKQKEKNVYKEEYLPGNRYGTQTVYNKRRVKKTVKVSNLDKKNFLDNFSKYTIVSCVFFTIFIIASTILITVYPGGFFNNRVMSSIALTIILMISILWVISLTMHLFKDSEGSKMKNGIMLLIGLGFLVSFILFFVNFLSNLNGETNIIRLITNSIILFFYAVFFIRTIFPDVFLPYINFSYFGASYSIILVAIILYMFCGALITYFTSIGFMLQILFYALIGLIIGYFSGFCTFVMELIAIIKIILVSTLAVLVAYSSGLISATSSETLNVITMIQVTFFALLGILLGYYTGFVSFVFASAAAIKMIFIAFLSILIAYTMGFINTISTETINMITIIQLAFFAFVGIMIGYFGGFISLFIGSVAAVQMFLFALSGILLAYIMGFVGDISKLMGIFHGLPIYVKIGLLCIILSIVVWMLLKLPSGTLKTSMLAFVPIILFLIYYYLPTIQGIIATQGGKMLIDNPISLNMLTILSNYEDLNGSNESTYKFAISFWVNIDAAPPSTNASYSNYTSIMNYGEKPNVLYNPSLNSFMITMQQKDFQEKNVNVVSEFDGNGNRILYTNNNFLLQKWNNVIINYDGGTLDVFLNGDLVRTTIEVIPYITMDALTIGATDGIIGNICNFVYYTNALTTTNIFYIYNSMKNENPPAPKKTNDTIVSKIEGGAIIVGNQIGSEIK